MSIALRSRVNFLCREIKGILSSPLRLNSTATLSPPSKISPLRYTLAGVGLGAIAGGGYSLYKLKSEPSVDLMGSIEITTGIKTLKAHPDVPISRKVCFLFARVQVTNQYRKSILIYTIIFSDIRRQRCIQIRNHIISIPNLSILL